MRHPSSALGHDLDTIAPDSYLGESSLDEYARGVSTLPVYDEDEERRLFRAARDGDEAAFEALVVSHLRFVVELALERRGWGIPLVGLIQAGNAGLVKAARRFDPDGDRRFREYAVWWVRQGMMDALDVA